MGHLKDKQLISCCEQEAAVSNFVKFVGLSAEAALAVELHRQSASETESDIILRVVGSGPSASKSLSRSEGAPSEILDIGQGIELKVGETAYLFLSKSDALRNRPAKAAIVTAKGLEMDGQVFPPERGSYVHLPMKRVQELLGHTGADGRPTSLSAYRQWHVVRDGKMVSLESLKDPAKARRRRSNLTLISAEELSKLIADIEP
jgi:hypothetical protein